MIGFLQQAWFLWWILAAVIVLRWFHLFSYRSDDRDLEARRPGETEASAASKQGSSRTSSRGFAYDQTHVA